MNRNTLSPARVNKLLQAAAKTRVLVVGDVMLDQFIWGSVARISPEAPVPVVDFQRGDRAAVATRIEPMRLDDLPVADVSWLRFLRATVAEAAGDRDKAREAYAEAVAASTSAAAAAWRDGAGPTMAMADWDP